MHMLCATLAANPDMLHIKSIMPCKDLQCWHAMQCWQMTTLGQHYVVLFSVGEKRRFKKGLCCSCIGQILKMSSHWNPEQLEEFLEPQSSGH